MLIIKGFIIGLAKVIPGVSGAVIAISMGIYDKAILAITEFFSDTKNNFKFLFKLGIGIFFAVIIGSKIILYFLDNHYVIAMLFLLGLIMGSLPKLYKQADKSINGYIIMVFTFIILSALAFVNPNYNYKEMGIIDYFIYFLSGIVDAIGTVVPGVSSTALLMLMGTYNNIMAVLSNLISIKDFVFNMKLIIPYSIGMLIGIMVVSLIMAYLLKKHKEKTYAFIFGLVLASIFLLLIRTFNNSYIVTDLIMGVVLLILGLFISKRFAD